MSLQSARCSRWEIACVHAICTRPVTPGCRATHGGRPGSSSTTMASTRTRTRTPAMKGSTGSTFTRCALPPMNCGAIRLHLLILCILTYGTVTLSTPDIPLEHIAALPRLPRDDDGPVFAEPWQAQAFALAIRLSEQGYFTWKDWTATLAEELRAAEMRGEPDDGSHYYEHWLATLERLVTSRGLIALEVL